MNRVRDLRGQRFGLLTAVEPCGRNKYDALWLCKCDCGNTKVIQRGCLVAKNGTRSCGCLIQHENHTGKQYGRLTALKEQGRTPDDKILWLCRCDCGNTAIVRGNYLKSGHTTTCGHCKQVRYDIHKDEGYVLAETPNGYVFKFDLADYGLVKRYLWMYDKTRGYVTATIRRKTVMLHRYLMNASEGSFVDHVDRDRSNNQRSNLRFADKQGNSANTGLKRNNKTGYKGVDDVGNGKYHARIGVNKKKIWLGSFDSPIEAAHAYDNAARFFFGKYACTNAMLYNTMELNA